MKHTIMKAVLAVAMLAGAGKSHGQVAPDSGNFSGLPAGIAILTTNSTPGAAIFIPAQRTVTVYCTANSGSTTNSGAEALTFLFGRSGDNTYFSTNRSSGTSVTLVASSTNAVTAYAQITMGGAKYVRWQGLENQAGGQATNYWTNLSVSFQVN